VAYDRVKSTMILTLVPETVLLIQSLVSILNVVVYHLCSLGSLQKDRLVDCGVVGGPVKKENNVVFFISVYRTTIRKWNMH